MVNMLAMISGSRLTVFLFSLAFSVTAAAQQPPPGGPGQTTQPSAGAASATQPQTGELPSDISSNYTLGPNDQILIRAPCCEEINERPFRIDSEGYVSLPMIGRIRAAGLTVQQLVADVTNRLREFFVKPEVFINVTQFRGAPVFFVGMFQRPGIVTLQGRRTLLEMLAYMGGLQPNASRRIRIRRHLEYGPIPLPNAVDDPEKKTSTVEISFASLRENVNPAEDIVLQPNDVVTVDRAEPVYVAGEVTRPGPIDLGERDYLTVTQALTMSGGFTRDAKRADVRVLRPIIDTNRRAEIPINLTGIYEGKVNDFPLLPNDLLYVPHSSTRTILTGLVPIGLSVLNPFIYLAIQGH
jgi:polysaccharide export outer membrane protein